MTEDYPRDYPRRSFSQSYAEQIRVRTRKRRITLIVAVALVGIALGVGAFLYNYFQDVSENLHEGLDPNLTDVLVKTDLSKEPFYIVFIGTDGSTERAGSEEASHDGFRSDSLMLVRIDPVKKKVTLVSIHRDTMVDMGIHGVNKINASLVFGGPALTVQMVKNLAGVDINHYAEINFDGFCSIVDTLGGIDVDVPMVIDDPDAGGYLAAGPQKLNGEQALILCRARHAYDDYGDGDAYRAANQRLVLEAIARKLLAADLVTMTTTVAELSKYITTTLEVTDIIGLAQSMRSLDPGSDIYSAMQPTNSLYEDDIWFEITDSAAWETMMTRVKMGLPPTEDSIVDDNGTILANAGNMHPQPTPPPLGNGGNNTGPVITPPVSSEPASTVVVKNGSGVMGVAASAGDILAKIGYDVETGNADSYDYAQTLIIYRDANQAVKAKSIAVALGAGVPFHNDGTYTFFCDYLVVIGADYQN